jgi:tRNA threonylcarbamoyladenosine biosynthesis protein TsaB
MTILALEFSSTQRSVAVARGTTVLGEAMESGPRSTAAFALIENALAQAKLEREQIEVIAVGLGPGSYTGVRAAIALAQGWRLARGTNTTGVSSVAAIAEQAREEKLFCRVNIIVDAQRGEFYFAAFEVAQASWTEIAPLKILSLTEAQARIKEGGILIGPEVTKFFPDGRTLFPRAAAVARLAAAQNDFLPGEKLEPIYLRETTFVKAAK